MARSIKEIQNQIIQEKDKFPTLSGLNSVSKTAIWRLTTYIVALAIHQLEVLIDLFKREIKINADSAISGTARWYVRKVLEFQYDAGNPQVLEVSTDTGSIYLTQYPVIDTNLQIITRAAVVTNSEKQVLIKVAKGEIGNLEPLNNDELTALISYVENFRFAGTNTSVISLFPDRLMINADIYIDGQFVESVVREEIYEAIDNYLANLEFDGRVKESEIENAIQDVNGVKDVVLNTVHGRPNADTIQQAVQFKKDYYSSAGYLIPEDESGYTFDDTIKIHIE